MFSRTWSRRWGFAACGRQSICVNIHVFQHSAVSGRAWRRRKLGLRACSKLRHGRRHSRLGRRIVSHAVLALASNTVVPNPHGHSALASFARFLEPTSSVGKGNT